jgi:toxin secretion/phage lysis holin
MNAPEKAVEIKAAIAGIIAFLTALWGWVGWAVILWLACIVMDYLAGTFAARKSGEWSSSIARAGLWHKLGEIFAVLVAAMCDIALAVIVKGSGISIGIDVGPLVTPVVLVWYIITELGSIIENAGKLGAPIPGWLKRSLKQYKDTIDHSQGGSEEEPEKE